MQKEQAKRLARAVVILAEEIRKAREERISEQEGRQITAVGCNGDTAAAGAIVASLVSGGREMLQDERVL